MTYIRVLIILFIIHINSTGINAQPPSDKTPKELIFLLKNKQADTARIKLLLQLGYFYVIKPGAFKNDMDSAATAFNSALKLSRKLNSKYWENETLKLIGDSYLEQHNIVHGKECFMKVINYYQLQGDERGQAYTWQRFGECLPIIDTALIVYKRAVYERSRLLFIKIHNRSEEINVEERIGYIDFLLGKTYSAENESLAVLAKYKANHENNLYIILSTLADINKQKGDFKNELYYRLEAIKDFGKMDFDYEKDVLYYALGKTYFDMGWYDNSLEAFRVCLTCKKNISKDDQLGNCTQLARVLIKLGRPKEALVLIKDETRELSPVEIAASRNANKAFGYCFSALNQFDKAEKYFLQTIKLDELEFHEQLYSKVGQYEIDYKDLCDLYLKYKLLGKANYYADKFLALPQSAMNPVIMNQFQLVKFKIDSAGGDYHKALNSYQAYTNLNNSLYKALKGNQIAELRIKYETAKQFQTISLLKNQAQAQNTAYQKLNLERKLTMALVILLVLITGLIFNGFRRNRKSNVRLQLKQSEVNLKNTSLEALNNKQQLLLQEKELLLREIHHRVKNNLQTTMSLLNMQTSYLSNNDAIEALRNSQQRIYSMSLVHQKLYQSDDLYTINMKDYIQELAGYLGENFGISGKITFQFNLDKIYMDLAQAIPVGLIINESLTNALKYAFPGEKKGIIKIQLTKQANSELLLCISDDGIGLPESIDYEPSRTLGLNLITGLASQLQGSVEIQKTLGMSLLIRFKNNEQTDEDINDDICV